MTTLNRAWGNMTVLGKILLPLMFIVLVVGPLLTILIAAFVGPWSWTC